MDDKLQAFLNGPGADAQVELDCWLGEARKADQQPLARHLAAHCCGAIALARRADPFREARDSARFERERRTQAFGAVDALLRYVRGNERAAFAAHVGAVGRLARDGARITLFDQRNYLEALHAELASDAAPTPGPPGSLVRFACLGFPQPVADSSLPQLSTALAVAIEQALRQYLAQGISGLRLPAPLISGGRIPWSVVTQFVNAAHVGPGNSSATQIAASVRQFRARHPRARIIGWPNPE